MPLLLLEAIEPIACDLIHSWKLHSWNSRNSHQESGAPVPLIVPSLFIFFLILACIEVDDLELLMFLYPTFDCWDSWIPQPPCFILCSAGD